MSLNRNVAANFAGSLTTAVMSVVFIPVYVHYLGIEAFGLVGFSATLSSLLGIANIGLSTTLNREFARRSARGDSAAGIRTLLRTVEGCYVGLAALAGGLVLLAAPLIASRWLNSASMPADVVTDAVRLMGIVFACQFPIGMYSGGLQGLGRQVRLNAILSAASVLRALVSVAVLAVVSPTVHAFFVTQAVLALLQSVFLAWSVWRSLPSDPAPARFDLNALRPIWQFAAGMFGIGLLSILLIQADKIVVSKALPLAAFGYYMIASSVGSSLGRLTAPIHAAVFPRLAQLRALGDEAGLSSLYHTASQWMSVVIVPPAVILAMFAPEVLRVWTGDPVIAARASTVLSLLIIGTMMNGLMNLPYAVQLAHGVTRLALVSNIIAVLVLIPGTWWMSKVAGAEGAASVWVVLNLGYVTILVYVMHRRILPGDAKRWWGRDVGLPLAASAATALLFRLVFRGPHAGLAAVLIVGAASAATLAAAAAATPASRTWLLDRLTRRNRAPEVPSP